MRYDFIADDGQTIERVFPMKNCPDQVQEDGKVFKRVAFSRNVQGLVRNFAHVAYNLPRHAEGAPHYTKDGRAAFETEKQVKEFAAKNSMKWD